MGDTELMLAVPVVRDVIPKDKPLKERVQFAMDYVLSHERDLFWMSYQVTDDMMLRTALGGVMLAGSEEDKDLIVRSMAPLKALSAAMSGVPVDFSALGLSDDLLPLLGMFKDAKAKPLPRDTTTGRAGS